MSSGTQTCPLCGESDFEVDGTTCTTTCVSCGAVVDENNIVSEVQFEDNARGGSSTVGKFVSDDGRSCYGSGRQLGRRANDITLENGRRRTRTIGQQLKLTQATIDMACNLYDICFRNKWTQGRRTELSAGACLYIACRHKKQYLMLLDISDVIQINVYVLGKTYLTLARNLNIKAPQVEPEFYILRYAHRLHLIDKDNINRTTEVSNTAVRLVKRMHADWLSVGRRPSGLCGAALLVAARMHEFSRTTRDIIKVVKVCETTLKKRLTEFGDTKSSQLTLTEFMSIDLEDFHDPPAFTAAREKAKLEKQQNSKEVAEEIIKLRKEIDEELKKTRPKKKTYFGQSISLGDSDEDDIEMPEETMDSINDFLQGKDSQVEENSQESFGESPVKSTLLQGLKPTTTSLGLIDSLEECLKTGTEQPEEDDDGELDLTGIDDEEIDRYIMTEAEAKQKTDMWTAENAEYLQEQKEKEERAAKELEENAGKPPKKKRKVNRKKKQTGPANTAGEAIEKMLQEKRISKKINYDVLKNLNSKEDGIENVPRTPSRSLPPAQSTPIADRMASIIFSMSSLEKKSRTQRLPTLGKSLKKPSSVLEEPEKVESEPKEPEIILDTGPIGAPDEYEDDEEDEDEDDDGLSFGRHRLEDDYDDQYGYSGYDDS